jgi:RNA polymerase sigma factor (sigma-70 family)
VIHSSDGRPALTSTTELIDRARAGDVSALDALFARLYPPLRRWTRGRLPGWARDLADTDDLVQEALVRTFTHLGQFAPRGVGALQGYVRQAILNRIRDELRKASRRPGQTAFDGTEPGSDLSPLEQVIGGESVARYERSLARLKPRDREVVIARLELGFDYDELAELLGTPTVGAARKAAERALVRLAAEMRDDAQRSARR